MNGWGCSFIELGLMTNHAWASAVDSIQGTRGRMLMDLEIMTLNQDKPLSGVFIDLIWQFQGQLFLHGCPITVETECGGSKALCPSETHFTSATSLLDFQVPQMGYLHAWKQPNSKVDTIKCLDILINLQCKEEKDTFFGFLEHNIRLTGESTNSTFT